MSQLKQRLAAFPGAHRAQPHRFAPSQNSRAMHGMRQVFRWPRIDQRRHSTFNARSIASRERLLMRLPNAEHAILDIRKLEAYCLNEDHPIGKHKAKVFRSALTLTAADAAWLREQILKGLPQADASLLHIDLYGIRYRVDLPIRRQNRKAMVRTIWIADERDHVSRFVTCWVL